MGALLWALVSLVLAAGLYAGLRAAPGLTPFVLESIRVEGAEKMRAGAILDAAGLKPGMGLFTVDVQAVRRAAEALPWVRRASVLRQLPSILTVAVEEWKPAYLVHLDRLYYLTPEGHVVKAPLDRGLDYPVVTGLTWADLEGAGPTKEALLELFSFLGKSFSGGEVSEIHSDPTAGFTVYTASNPGQGIHLGLGGLEEKFSRLARLRRQLQKRGEAARSVNLACDDKIIARLVPAAKEGPKP